MTKRIYMKESYLESWNAVYQQTPDEDYFLFTHSKPILTAREFRFKINTKLKILNSLPFLFANFPENPLINKDLQNLLLNECRQDIQFIPIIIQAKDGLSQDYFIMNVLHTEAIIDENNSGKIFIDKEKNDYFLDLDNLTYLEDTLSSHNIARDDHSKNSSILFFSDRLSAKITEKKLNKHVFFK